MRAALFLALFAGCSNILGIEDLRVGDAGGDDIDASIDAPADAVDGPRVVGHAFRYPGAGFAAEAVHAGATVLVVADSQSFTGVTDGVTGEFTVAVSGSELPGLDRIDVRPADATGDLASRMYFETEEYVEKPSMLDVRSMSRFTAAANCLAGDLSLDPSEALVVVYLQWPDGRPAEEATVVASQAGDELPVRYTNDAGQVDPKATTSAPNGVAVVCNVPVGRDIALSANGQEVSYRIEDANHVYFVTLVAGAG